MSTRAPQENAVSDPAVGRQDLLRFARETAANPAVIAQLEFHPRNRTWIALEGPRGSEAWVIGWPPGTSTGWHDHGGSEGAFVVAGGELREYALDIVEPPVPGAPVQAPPDATVRTAWPTGTGRWFGAGHLHALVNESPTVPAVSVHVYDPPLPWMRRYLFEGGVFALTGTEYADEW